MNDNKARTKSRTIHTAYKEIEKLDPNTAVSVRTLRRLVQENVIPSYKAGNRTLINLDIALKKISGLCYDCNVSQT